MRFLLASRPLFCLICAALVGLRGTPISAQNSGSVSSQGDIDAATAAKILKDFPPGTRLEDVARLTIERVHQRKNAEEQPSRRAGFEAQMKLAAKNGDYPTMIFAAKQQAQAVPDDGLAPFYLGLSHFYEADFAAALAAWQQARRVDPSLAPRIAPLEARARRIMRRFPDLRLGAVKMVPSDMIGRNQAAFDLGKAALQAHNYAAIERAAARFERDKTADLSGQLALDDLMSGMLWQESNDSHRALRDDEIWKARLAKFEAWHRADPHSALAAAGIIETQTGWAWSIRGGEYADRVSEAQWQQVRQHLDRAAPIIAQLPRSALQSESVCHAVLKWSHLSGVPEPTMRAMWADFQRRFPDAFDLACLWSVYLLPQWSGQPGETAKFWISWANLRPGAAGDIRYAQMAIRNWDYILEKKMCQNGQVQWPRVKRGLQALMKAHPTSNSLATGLMQMSSEVGDFATAQNALIQRVRNRASSSRYASPRDFAVSRLHILDPAGN